MAKHTIYFATFVGLFFSSIIYSWEGLRMNAGELSKHCSQVLTIINKEEKPSIDKDSSLTCIYYLTGVLDGIKTTAAITQKNFNPTLPYCIPNDVNMEKLIKIFIEFVKDHPDASDAVASLIFIHAIHEKYPCKAH